MDWEKIFTIGSPIIIAIIASSIAYFQAVKTGNIRIKEIERQSQIELEKIRETHKHELEKIQTEMETQAKLYEQNKQTDLIGDAMNGVMGNFMKSPLVQKKLEEEFKKAFK
ncbi:hypothetical protein J2D69_14815 [Lysinibacillus sphaericus]|jgi:hypothetical protein|uniref:Uncharacterized protein n=3 Tax=Lysinibacillus TaxID=400634 RepID=B1HRZ5_LYSSC|nr:MULTISPECIES: hypothetical protein [Lysinibacillus]MBE5084195.1 hypothetical protein [Bacillus thuringiensis]ACA41018.1 hypothetical protein Bsph_3530 [Lysinibacillus sphaericus C3-41]AMO33044.1 hypothetical protein AR327_11635 [Lysinibacillus sphaericus]AMR91851.1 hypothetical protein A1T07_17575 [Lysinibacillus sphaericus]ANA45899.1 hypothetical protein A2J09_10240 [Lysinibacillus sphaericus]